MAAVVERTLDFESYLSSNFRSTTTDCGSPSKALLPSLNFTSETKKTTFALFPSQGYLEITDTICMKSLRKFQIAVQIERTIITFSALTEISGPTF